MNQQTAWTWVGDSIQSFNFYGESMIPIFTDMEDFNFVEDGAVVCIVQKSSLSELPSGVSKNMIFSINHERQIMIAYDFTKDVYHFFTNVNSKMVHAPRELLAAA